MDPHGPSYNAEAVRCHACEARDNSVKSWHDDKDADTAGIYFAVSEE